MVTDIWLFSIFLLITGALIFILVFFIITLSGESLSNIWTSGSSLLHSDLECDYLNAQECCGRLNFWNIPKLWLQLVILAVLLVSGHWSLVLLNIPVCAWLVRKFHWVPRGNIGKVSVQYPIGNLFSCTLLRSKHEGYMKLFMMRSNY